MKTKDNFLRKKLLLLRHSNSLVNLSPYRLEDLTENLAKNEGSCNTDSESIMRNYDNVMFRSGSIIKNKTNRLNL